MRNGSPAGRRRFKIQILSTFATMVDQRKQRTLLRTRSHRRFLSTRRTIPLVKLHCLEDEVFVTRAQQNLNVLVIWRHKKKLLEKKRCRTKVSAWGFEINCRTPSTFVPRPPIAANGARVWKDEPIKFCRGKLWKHLIVIYR